MDNLQEALERLTNAQNENEELLKTVERYKTQIRRQKDQISELQDRLSASDGHMRVVQRAYETTQDYAKDLESLWVVRAHNSAVKFTAIVRNPATYRAIYQSFKADVVEIARRIRIAGRVLWTGQ